MALNVELSMNRVQDDTLLRQRIIEYAIMTQAFADQYRMLVTPQPGAAMPGSLAPVWFPVENPDRSPDTDTLPHNANKASIRQEDEGSISITPGEYGDTVPYAKSLIAEKGYPFIEMQGKRFTDREIRRQMLVILNAAAANPNTHLINGAADVDALGADDVMTLDTLRRIRVMLSEEQSAPRFADPAVGGGVYRAVLPEAWITDLGSDVNNLNGLTDPAKYLDPTIAFSGEIGVIEGMRIVRQSDDLVTSLGAANGTADLCRGFFAGMNFIGEVVNNPITVVWEERPGDYEKRFWQYRSHAIYGYGTLRSANGLTVYGRSRKTANP